jgi:hypothetical protein
MSSNLKEFMHIGHSTSYMDEWSGPQMAKVASCGGDTITWTSAWLVRRAIAQLLCGENKLPERIPQSQWLCSRLPQDYGAA